MTHGDHAVPGRDRDAAETGDTLATGSAAPPPDARALERALGQQIRQLRRQRDLSTVDLAAAAGISAGMLSKIENGQISPSLSTLQGVAAGAEPLSQAEVMVYGKQAIGALLDSHRALFHPHCLNDYGLMTLVSKRLEVVDSGDVFVHRERGFLPQGNLGLHARNIQFVTVAAPAGRFSVMNFHGLWNGQGKGDSDERIAQSRRM